MSARLVNFSRAVDPAVTEVFNGAFKQAKSVYADICSVKKATNYITEMGANAGLSMARLRAEQESVWYEDILQDTGKNLTQYEYSVGCKISDKLQKWNKLGQIKAVVQSSALAVARRREFDKTKLLERGYTTSYTHSVDGSSVIQLTGGGSLALFSASHATLRSSTSRSNIIGDGTTSNMDLAEDALEAAETVTAAAITDENDQVMEYDLDTLFTSRKKSWTAMRLLKTSAGRIGTPNNDINLIYGRYKLVRLDYMDSAYADYWFLKDSAMNNNEGFMSCYEGSGLEKDGPYVDFDTKAIKYSWSFEDAAGHNKWQSYLGSQGDNT
jgi:hypothetical protein